MHTFLLTKIIQQRKVKDDTLVHKKCNQELTRVSPWVGTSVHTSIVYFYCSLKGISGSFGVLVHVIQA